jgi:hypothetical protein
VLLAVWLHNFNPKNYMSKSSIKAAKLKLLAVIADLTFAGDVILLEACNAALIKLDKTKSD